MRTPVLDHGYVELVESWGSDERIIEAARMSTAKGFQGWGGQIDHRCNKCGYRVDVLSIDYIRRSGEHTDANGQKAQNGGTAYCPNPRCLDETLVETTTPPGDEKLLRFLWENWHYTPFEMAGLTVEVQAPIFVFREWHRHRTQSYNELSARYTPVPDVNYTPTFDRLFIAAGSNKQAQGVSGIVAEPGNAKAWLHDVEAFYAQAEHLYQMGLNMGLPKEIARIVMPVGRYSRMRASANLRNWLHFLSLRIAPNAQWEIRQYAEALAPVFAEKFPRTWTLFEDGGKRA